MSDIGQEQPHKDYKFIPSKDGHDHVIPPRETNVPERSGVAKLPEDKRIIVPPTPPVPDMTPQTPEQSFWHRILKQKNRH